MNLYTFFNAVATAIKKDETLRIWCEVEIGDEPDVRMDVPGDNLPDIEADGPYITLGSPAKVVGQTRDRIEYYIEIELGFSLGTYKTRADDVSEPSGIELMCKFCERVLAVIKNDLPNTNFIISEVNMMTDTLGHADDVLGLMAVAFEEQLTIGDDPLV